MGRFRSISPCSLRQCASFVIRPKIHVGFKVAAELGDTWYQALAHHADVIGRLVTQNLLEKHIKPVFVKS